jgi:hypothetical protein
MGMKNWMLKENLPRLGPKVAQEEFRAFISYLRAVMLEADKCMAGLERSAFGAEWATLLGKLKLWLRSHHDPGLYEDMMRCLEKSKTQLADEMRSVLYRGQTRILNYFYETGTWIFSLTPEEGQVASSAVEYARLLAGYAYEAVASLNPQGPPSDAHNRAAKNCFNLYFCNGMDDARARAKAWPIVQSVLNKTVHALITQPARFVVCPPTWIMNNAAKTAAHGLACSGGKNELGGPTLHLFKKFFEAHPGEAQYMEFNRGCTIVHEATHMFADTKDVNNKKCYGRDTCFGLKQELAIQNADSYGLFAYDLSHHGRTGDYNSEFMSAMNYFDQKYAMQHQRQVQQPRQPAQTTGSADPFADVVLNE